MGVPTKEANAQGVKGHAADCQHVGRSAGRLDDPAIVQETAIIENREVHCILEDLPWS